MSVVSDIVSGANPANGVLGVAKALIGHFFPDPIAAAEATQKLEELEQSGELAKIGYQAQINLQEAKGNWFVAGWRPAAGWVCVLGFGVQFVFGPLLEWSAALFHYVITAPKLDIAPLLTMLMGMLGLGSLRTYEKKTDSESNR